MIESTQIAAWGWALLAGGAVAFVVFAYHFIWRERYRLPFGMAPGSVRLRGRVSGPPRRVIYCIGENGEEILATPFILHCEDGTRVPVLPSGAVLAVQPLRHRLRGRLRTVAVGDQITVDGTPTTVQRPESLYREAGRVSAVEAIRIVGGNWPELRWLRLPAVAGAAVFLLSLVQILFTPTPPPTQPAEGAFCPVLAHRTAETPSTFYFTSHGDPGGGGVLLGDQVGRPLSKDSDVEGLGLFGDLFGPQRSGPLLIPLCD